MVQDQAWEWISSINEVACIQGRNLVTWWTICQTMSGCQVSSHPLFVASKPDNPPSWNACLSRVPSRLAWVCWKWTDLSFFRCDDLRNENHKKDELFLVKYAAWFYFESRDWIMHPHFQMGQKYMNTLILGRTIVRPRLLLGCLLHRIVANPCLTNISWWLWISHVATSVSCFVEFPFSLSSWKKLICLVSFVTIHDAKESYKQLLLSNRRKISTFYDKLLPWKGSQPAIMISPCTWTFL
jgi:hypothetical protein